MSGEPLKLVLGVDVLVRALCREADRAVLELWRDGLIRPVLHRPLLRRYLLALERMGLAEPVVRGWATWLASPEKSLYLRNTPEEEGAGEGNSLPLVGGLYLEAARLGDARVVVTGAARPERTERRAAAKGDGPEAPELIWLTPAEFLKRVREEN